MFTEHNLNSRHTTTCSYDLNSYDHGLNSRDFKICCLDDSGVPA